MAAVGEKEETFDVWMKQESDTVQALGMAYAERETIEASYRVIQQVCFVFVQKASSTQTQHDLYSQPVLSINVYHK